MIQQHYNKRRGKRMSRPNSRNPAKRLVRKVKQLRRENIVLDDKNLRQAETIKKLTRTVNAMALQIDKGAA